MGGGTTLSGPIAARRDGARSPRTTLQMASLPLVATRAPTNGRGALQGGPGGLAAPRVLQVNLHCVAYASWWSSNAVPIVLFTILPFSSFTTSRM
ncbi:MAG: hypothetical protein KatS3mg116_2798 [Elioraea sp.]|nr:MAG: hypothetical protein KatS3mg116_2798 [Elioraea sp.]